MNTNSLISGLARVGSLFYEKMSERVSSGNYPPSTTDNKRNFSTIPAATMVKEPQPTQGGFEVSIVIDLKKAPFAAAYEWGSGEHGRSASAYEIKAKQMGRHLIFPLDDWPRWEDWREFGIEGGVYPNKNGLFYLGIVSHPGVESRPYIQPTMQEIRPEVRKILARDFKEMVISS